MIEKILVAYASKYGSTKDIADKVRDGLERKGHKVDIFSVENVKDISQYQVVILGSAVYIGQWRKEAARFLKKYSQELSNKKTWLFSTGPTGEGNPVELMNGWDFPEGLKPVAEKISPRDIQVFHGFIDETRLNWLHKGMIKKVKAAIGDFRDWEAINTWIEQISQEIHNSD
ncbi:MAG: flavodoxin domain-containing protein [Anaerolineaceae bacterium]|nr:flavodoxin domain-containing protein [Anaerolineaceae bacterium]